MAQDPDEQTSGKKTVRKVVRKTAAPTGRPPVTLGRPSREQREATSAGGLTKKSLSRPSGQAVGNASGRTSTAGTTSSQQPAAPIKRATRASAAGLSSSTTRLARGARSATHNAAATTQSSLQRVRSIRLPATPQPLASAIAGLLTGLLIVTIGWGLTLVFSWLRGTSTGGQRWGIVSVAMLLVVALVVNAVLLHRLGVRRSRLTSLCSTSAGLAVILAFFIDLINGPWVWLIVPIVLALTCAVMHKTLLLADEYAKD